MDQLYRELEGEAFTAISVVAQNKSGELPGPVDAASWADGLELSLTVLADDKGAFWPVWNPAGVLPVTYVIDRQGRVSWADYGDAGSYPALRKHVIAAVKGR